MADLVITAANVVWNSGVRPLAVKGGATIARGKTLYQNTTTLKHLLADADTDAESEFTGIAITDGTDGSDMLIAPPGANINVGATTTAGTIYVLSTTPGGIAPWADLGTGDYVVVLFIGTGTANVDIIGKKMATFVHA